MKAIIDAVQYAETIKFIEENNKYFDGNVQQVLDGLIAQAQEDQYPVSTIGITVIPEEEGYVNILVDASVGKTPVILEGIFNT